MEFVLRLMNWPYGSSDSLLFLLMHKHRSIYDPIQFHWHAKRSISAKAIWFYDTFLGICGWNRRIVIKCHWNTHSIKMAQLAACVYVCARSHMSNIWLCAAYYSLFQYWISARSSLSSSLFICSILNVHFHQNGSHTHRARQRRTG